MFQGLTVSLMFQGLTVSPAGVMTSTVRVSSVLEKPFPQRRRSTGQLHALVPPGADFPPENIRRGSGELSGDNLRTIHENSPGLQVGSRPMYESRVLVTDGSSAEH